MVYECFIIVTSSQFCVEVNIQRCSKVFFGGHNRLSLVLILILISIKTRIGNILSQKPPPPNPTQQETQTCLILPKLLTFQVIHQNKNCLSIQE